ncbi:MAG: molybdopterin oxidoreductase family protein [Clostridium tyrobutyricum]|jgi:assimilatory nitrate reductase catalytic subunit|uniref:molybdopterin oxidoreductase family protein n=1 Tax=Clostridium tyrobutyricum TaxID=1519 RepID=UPI00242EB4DC|nr:molybdopterin oxidoreductase family protein [Clostridium tyrobutyricum]MCH4198524.1 molybdopterin oxidoreductase family protein [Clostridium tyrobutyricum]MCH4237416.1 molybdopterin oxidoreductase family protein [Clostridium tyrobutyricum]MCH4259007.1 molybdopterin oxidoreductase family protein [Clostridium tyrobutyricum]MCI1239859.1 molybdopterin oxidoreductase family protein [Clostridium tyrobutyricum]MCI1652972.1 molybdopterin oxidoreductase family protein [Clostridium tyrobutyricum]
MEIKQSTCNYCSLACNLEFYVEDNMIKKILPKKDYPVNGKFTCLKDINLDKQCSRYGKDKLPVLKDKYGNKRAISWNEAFELFADKMRYIQNKYGVESAAYISTGQITTEELALLGLVGRIHMGINGDGNTRLCMASTVMAYKQSFGFDAPPYTLKDLETSDTLVFIGANPAIAHPVAWSRVKKNKSASIVVIDPRESETAQNADIWLDIIPKSDIYLLYTLANVLIENNWIDREYIDNYTMDFDGFRDHVKKYNIASVEKNTGISSERVLELAQLIHNGKRVSFWWTMGVNQGYQAVRTAQAIINIAVMTGNIGREGTGPNSLTGQCNAMGSRMFSNTTALYGGRNFDNPKHRRDTAEILGVDEEKIPKKPTIPYSEIINRIDRGEIKSLWVIATNPRHSWANNKEFENAVKKLDFFVVQDLYGDTDSSKICDLFLPSVPLTKKQGSIINTERRLSAVVPVIDMGKDEMSDYDIFLGIGRALGMKQELEKWKTPLDAFNTIKELSRGMPCDITGIDYEMLVNSKGIQWPFKSGDKLLQDERRLFEDNIYFTQNGRMKFIYENVMENPYPVDSKFPYILNTGRISVGQWHTQSRTREINSGNSSIVKAAYVILNVKLAETLGIEEGDNVIISSINGNNSKFKARLSSMIKENQLYAPLHYIETNVLSVSVFDTYSKEPSYKYIPVNLEKI